MTLHFLLQKEQKTRMYAKVEQLQGNLRLLCTKNLIDLSSCIKNDFKL